MSKDLGGILSKEIGGLYDVNINICFLRHRFRHNG